MPPSFTVQPVSQRATLGQTIIFRATATGTPSPTYQWQLNGVAIAGATSSSLTLSSVTTNESGAYRVIATNAAGSATSEGATLTVVMAPTITTQPANLLLEPGETATFSVVASGLPAPTFQWRKDGSPLAGATTASLVLPAITASQAGRYDVVVINIAGSTTSEGAMLALQTAPVIVTQPQPQIIPLGGTAQLSIVASGIPEPTYQWRRNGLAISGATTATLALTNASEVTAGSYDVVVTNPRGSVGSALVQVSVTTANVAPVFTLQPASHTAVMGAAVTFSAQAIGTPAPSYQWRKDGTLLAGATGAALTVSNLQAGDADVYDVIAANVAGTATSRGATLVLIRHSFAGTYFGSFGSGLGTFALYIRSDNTGVLLGYLPGTSPPFMRLDLMVNDDGQFTVGASSATTITSAVSTPSRAAALAEVTITGVINGNGTLTGSVTGIPGATLAGTKSADSGTTQSFAGFYTAGAAGRSGAAYSIVSATGQAFILTQTSSGNDGGEGVIDRTGRITITTSNLQNIVANVTPATATMVASINTREGTPAIFVGATEHVLAEQRLANLSSRAQAGSDDAVAIAGFVVKGQQSKPVLIRAIGPALAAFGVSSALPAPKLELYRGDTLIGSNTGWGSVTNSDEIQAATARAGGFPLAQGSADAVIFTTLSPGNYSAIMRSATAASGVGLIEVYDVSPTNFGDRLANLSTRAFAGSGDTTLIAGVVVSGIVPKRVLIRAVGPTLAQLGVSNVLSRPRLVLQRGNVVIAENTGWSASPDAAAIAEISRQVGAFALPAGSQDAALLLHLEPGAYSAQVLGVGGQSGIAIIEIYEIP